MKVSSVIKLLVSCGTAAFSLAEQRAMPTSINEICQKQDPLSNPSICNSQNSSQSINLAELNVKERNNTHRLINTECKEDRWGNSDMESRCLVTNFGPKYVDIIPPDSNSLKEITVQANPNEKVDATLEIKSKEPFFGTFMMMCHSFFLYEGNDFIRGNAIGFSIQSGTVNAITTSQAIIIPIQEELWSCPVQTYLLSSDQIIQSSDVEMSKNLSRNSLFGIELDIEGNAKISFDMKEKKNESNTLNWKTFCPSKDVGIYTILNESSCNANYTLSVTNSCTKSKNLSNKTKNETSNELNTHEKCGSIDTNCNKTEIGNNTSKQLNTSETNNNINGQLSTDRTMVDSTLEEKNLFFISLMAIMGGAVSFFIFVMLARRLREYRTILSANHQCEDNTNRHEENETVTIYMESNDWVFSDRKIKIVVDDWQS